MEQEVMQQAMRDAMQQASMSIANGVPRPAISVIVAPCKDMQGACLIDACWMLNPCLLMQRKCLHLRKHACGCHGRTDGRTYVRTITLRASSYVPERAGKGEPNFAPKFCPESRVRSARVGGDAA